MPKLGKFREDWLRPFFFYGNNRLSLLGGAITTASAMVLIGFWVVSIFGHGGSSNPYLDIVFDLILPASLLLGSASFLPGSLSGEAILMQPNRCQPFSPRSVSEIRCFARAWTS